jgi:hypothetical protein
MDGVRRRRLLPEMGIAVEGRGRGATPPFSVGLLAPCRRVVPKGLMRRETEASRLGWVGLRFRRGASRVGLAELGRDGEAVRRSAAEGRRMRGSRRVRQGGLRHGPEPGARI